MNPHDARIASSSAAHQRTKLIAAIALAVALVAVLAWRCRGSHAGDAAALAASPPTEPSPATVIAPPTSPAVAAVVAATPTAGFSSESSPAKSLPKIVLTQVMASNPFLLSNGDATRLTDAAAADHLPITAAEGSLQAAHAAAAAATDLAAQSAPPSSDKPSEVSAIIRGANGRSILIGGRLARENDVVDDRWRIVAIRSDGVVVENIATPPQP